MYIALDKNNRVTYIDDTVPGHDYFCPVCDSKMIVKRGDIRRHYFAHSSGESCSDSWEKSYDISEWHRDWQNKFPVENREVVVGFGNIKHRADVLVGRTVIEFQHSYISKESYDNRTVFYKENEYKVIWLFDLSEEYADGKIDYSQENGNIILKWKNHRNIFKNTVFTDDNVELYVQVNKSEQESILRICDISNDGETFVSKNIISEKQFIDYFTDGNGEFEKPISEKITENEDYKAFKEKYNIRLDQQQERAVQAVDGATLVLAVPGSGKTTTLISHIGYMVKCKHILGESILALTYTKYAASNMRERYIKTFGDDNIKFCTLNSLAYKIISKYDSAFKTVDNKITKPILRRIFQKYNGRYPNEYELSSAMTTISYSKNMMLDHKDIINSIWDEDGWTIIDEYNNKLIEIGYIDFDDQLVRAFNILNNNLSALDYYRGLYKYICLDEAQDTSKLQFEFVKLLAGDSNNVFIVGDEDQSIYGFRAAYPKAILNFKNEFKNPFELKLETNYRSTEEIVDMSSVFSAKNLEKIPKRMISHKCPGKKPECILVDNRISQYERIPGFCITNRKTAFLYRDNSSSIPIIDELYRANIPFKLNKKDNYYFFTNGVVQDIKAYFELTYNDKSIDAIKQINNKCAVNIKYDDINRFADFYSRKYNPKPVIDALFDYLDYDQRRDGYIAEVLRHLINGIKNLKPCEAINYLLERGYSAYLKSKHSSNNEIEILMALAKKCNSLQEFVEHLKKLKKEIEQHDVEKANIYLSTLHSSKGLEYDTVYLIDVFDELLPAAFPSDVPDISDQYQEERRLFYVGITRAKEELYIFDYEDRQCSFTRELFPVSGDRLSKVIEDVKDESVLVLNKDNGKTYHLIFDSNRHYSAREINIETGEIIEGDMIDFYSNRNSRCWSLTA